MLKVKYLILMVLFTSLVQAEPCKPHKGQPFPWEGTGACTGNNHIEIPLETTSLSIHFHSADHAGDFGFGLAAWRLSADHRLIDDTNNPNPLLRKIILDRGDGTQIVLDKLVAGVWSGNPILTRQTAAFVSGFQWWEISPDGSIIFYKKTVSGKWVSIRMQDSKGNATTITRNNQGNITKITNPFGKEINVIYSTNGVRAISLKDYQGGTYFFGFNGVDADDQPADLNLLTEISRPDGSGWKIKYNDELMDRNVHNTQVIGYVEPDGSTHDYHFASEDSGGEYPDDVPLPPVGSTYSVDLPITLTGEITMPSHALRRYTYFYQGVRFSNHTNYIDERFNDQGQLVLSTAMGITTGYVRRSDGLPSIMTTDGGETITFGYDESTKNITSIQSSDGTLKTITYASLIGRPSTFANNNPETITTTKGSYSQAVSYTYDNQNRVSSVTPYLNNLPINDEVQIFERDAKGNVTKITKGGSATTSFTYNSFSQMTGKTDLITGMTTSYNIVAGQLVSATNPLGITTSYEYNQLGQVTKLINPDGTTQVKNYDVLGQEILNQTAGPSGAKLTTKTSRQSGTLASLDLIKHKTIEASFNFVPLISMILPWKQANAAGSIGYVPGATGIYTDVIFLRPPGGPTPGDVPVLTEKEEQTPTGTQAGTTDVNTSTEHARTDEECAQDAQRAYDHCKSIPPTKLSCDKLRDTVLDLCKKDSERIRAGQDSCKGKPVIYLYPERTQVVKVMLDFLGKLIATYPEYDTKKGWKVEARPDGTLTSLDDKKEYSYLFWEGMSDKPMALDWTKGFIVAGKDTRKFMQDTLAKMGLVPKEYNEFIVYWYPRLKDNAFNYIHFAGNPYTDGAKLDITPKPDSMLRIFMAFKPLESATEMKVTPQEFPKFERKGFVVVEWGGGEVSGPDAMKLGKKVAAGSAMNRME